MDRAKNLRIVFMGTPEFAVAPLRALVESGHNVVAVVTMPDKPAGRGLKIKESAVKTYSREAGLKVMQPEKLRDETFLEEIRCLRPDLGIVIAFRMLPEVLWSMPKHGTFNLHASLLPQYRGAAPINWAIINGDNKTGVTTFLLNREIDTGAIIGQTIVPVGPDDNAGILHDKLMETGTRLVLETVAKIAEGHCVPIEQEQIPAHSLKAAPKIFKETCRINWNLPCRQVRNLVRGLSPHPTAWSEMVSEDGRISAKIYSVEMIDKTAGVQSPGAIATDGKTFVHVRCADGWLSIGEFQPAGKKRMDLPELLRGFSSIDRYHFD